MAGPEPVQEKGWMNIMDSLTGYLYYPDSLAESEGTTFCLVRTEDNNAKFLGVMGNVEGFVDGRASNASTRLFPLVGENARALRQRLPWLNPRPLGLQTSAGFGDRLGFATPGHIRAMRETPTAVGAIAPIFAQQSVRENARTHRTPQQVLDDATWGVFQTGWRDAWGADADHLKTPADVDAFFDAGFTFFTIDPGDHVDNAAQTDSTETLKAKAAALPWDRLNDSIKDVYRRYLDQVFEFEHIVLRFDEITLLRALVKYGRAIAHTRDMAARLDERANGQPYDLEVSVDETEIPTSAEEHYFISSELKRLGVQWVSMAPRFVGRFEKGVDYQGDLQQFETEYAQHAAIARRFGYRLSLHSGSDKFSIYEIAARHSQGLVHLKTAGTSYLEALRVVAQTNPVLFRQIFHLVLDRYETDRASYHVSAQLSKVAIPDQLKDIELHGLLDQFDARQVFHVTFGATLDRFGPLLHDALRQHEGAYYEVLAAHFGRHLTPLLTYTRAPLEPNSL